MKGQDITPEKLKIYKDEKEIIDDAHQEYKAMHEDDEEVTKVEEKEVDNK